MKKSFILQETFLQNGKYFQAKTSYCYEREVMAELLPFDIDLAEMTEDLHYLEVIVDGVTYYIPKNICCITKCTVNPMFAGMAHNYYGNKHQDQTTDYIRDVKTEMGIDIRKSYVAQHNGSVIQKIAWKQKKDKWDHNRFMEETNTKEYEKPTCECPNEEPVPPEDIPYI